jgi:hypothetical protein
MNPIFPLYKERVLFLMCFCRKSKKPKKPRKRKTKNKKQKKQKRRGAEGPERETAPKAMSNLL